MGFTFPANLRFKCNGCALCCGDTDKKTRHILLLECEAEEIAAQTRQPKAAFCVPVEGKAPYVYEMKKSGDGKCVFLKENRCGIYPQRPLVCMFYPFELRQNENTKMHEFDFTAECPAIGEGAALTRRDFKKQFDAAKERLK